MRAIVLAPMFCTIALFVALIPTRSEAYGFVINELMPHNETWSDAEFLDEDDTKQGWIEIKNTGSSTSSLLGLSLTNDFGVPQMWPLPDVFLDPEESLVIWLSGKDRSIGGAPLHTNFSMMAGGDVYLFAPLDELVDSVVDTLIPVDKSYGRCSVNGESGYYYDVPSPGVENRYDDTVPFVIIEEHVSLSVGEAYQLRVWPDANVTWQSDNPNVTVSATGLISAAQDALTPDGQAVITAQLVGDSYSASMDVTIVNWTANVSKLEVIALPNSGSVLAQDETGIYFTIGSGIYKSANNLSAPQLVGTSPTSLGSTTRMLITPFGYVIRAGTSIYHSTDLTNWTETFQTELQGLRHMFEAYYDEATQTGYVYAGDYSSSDFLQRHKVYRGTFPNVGAPTWETLIEFPSLGEWLQDPSITEAVRHIHLVTVDPYTGHVWVGTGDANEHSRIYVSEDHGDTFQLLGLGDQSWRTLAVWFTADYVYWDMDTSAPQSIWRIPRTAHQPGGWPSMTPEISSGTTTALTRYYVTRNDNPGQFPVGVGEGFVEYQQSTIDANNTVLAVNDPAYDYRELVAELINGSHWFQLSVKNGDGDDITLVSTAPEGTHRDERARIFGIKEVPGNPAIVQELHSLAPEIGTSGGIYTQLTPLAQDPAGFIYMTGRESEHLRYQTRLYWYDDAASMPPASGPSPPAVPEICVPEPGELLMLAGALPVLALLGRRQARRRTRSAPSPTRTPSPGRPVLQLPHEPIHGRRLMRNPPLIGSPPGNRIETAVASLRD